MPEPNVDVLKRGYAALNRGDLSVVLELLDPEIQWHEPAPSPEAVVRQSDTGRSSGLRVDARLAHVWTVADGKAVRWEAVAAPEAALADGG